MNTIIYTVLDKREYESIDEPDKFRINCDTDEQAIQFVNDFADGEEDLVTLHKFNIETGESEFLSI